MNLNICEQEVLEHFQQIHKHRLYKIGDVTAIMDVGKKRNHQEDSLLISNHKQFSNKQLLLVADGMGGEPNGELASNIAAIETFKWFQNLDKDTLNNISKLKQKVNIFIPNLHDEVGKQSHWGCTTLVAAVINEEAILILNIGDSRAYVYDENLKQITKDHSYVQDLYDHGFIKNKDNMRFHRYSNIINTWLGGVTRQTMYDFYELDKSKINNLFLCSDGVSDCISHNDFENIVKSNDNPCDDIVKYVLSHNSYLEDQGFGSPYNKIIPAGKDNISLICKKITKKR